MARLSKADYPYILDGIRLNARPMYYQKPVSVDDIQAAETIRQWIAEMKQGVELKAVPLQTAKKTKA